VERGVQSAPPKGEKRDGPLAFARSQQKKKQKKEGDPISQQPSDEKLSRGERKNKQATADTKIGEGLSKAGRQRGQ